MLCISILCVNCLYIPFSMTKPNLSSMQRNQFCNLIGFFFHYFLLTSFMWMFIMAVIQYVQFVRIFNSHISHFFLKTCCLGWIMPLLFPFLVILIGSNGGYTGEKRCWIHEPVLLYVTFLGPISLIILCNLILFLFTLKSIFHHDTSMITCQNNRSKLQMSATVCCFVSIGSYHRSVRCLWSLVFVGCTWLFGILVLLRPTFLHQLIFCVSNSLQGFLIFLFHVYLSKPKRELWQTFFIQHGLHQRPNSSLGHKQLLTKNTSSGGNISSLTRPVKFRFTSVSSNSDLPQTASSINPSYTDQNLSTTSVKESAQASRLPNPVVRTQSEFLLERAQQRNKIQMSNYYA